MLWSPRATTDELLCHNYQSPSAQSPPAAATETYAPRARALQQAKPPHRVAHAPELESSPPLAMSRERKPVRSKEDPVQPKTKKAVYTCPKKKKEWNGMSNQMVG